MILLDKCMQEDHDGTIDCEQHAGDSVIQRGAHLPNITTEVIYQGKSKWLTILNGHDVRPYLFLLLNRQRA